MATWKAEKLIEHQCHMCALVVSQVLSCLEVLGVREWHHRKCPGKLRSTHTLESKLFRRFSGLSKISSEGLVVFPAASFFPPPLLQKTLALWPGCWYHNMLSHIETRQNFSMWIVFSATYGGENRQWEGTWFVTVHPNVRSLVLPKNDRLK